MNDLRRIGRRTALLAGLAGLAGCATLHDVVTGNFSDLFKTPKARLPGKREPVLMPGEGPGPGNAGPVSLPPARVNASWAQPGGDAAHAMGQLALRGKMDQVWQADVGTGGGYRRKLTAQPVVIGNRVFSMDSRAVVNGYALSDGTRLWRTHTRAEDQRGFNIGGGISSDGVSVFAANGLADLVALDAATGKVRWRTNLGTPARSGPAIVDDHLYIPTIDSRIIACNRLTGKILWNYQGPHVVTGVLGEPAPAVADGFVVAGFDSGDLVALRADTGLVAWTDTLAAVGGPSVLTDFSAIRGLPVIQNGRVFAIGMGGLMIANDLRSGRRLWQVGVGGATTPWVADDVLFVVTSGQQMLALSATTGASHWMVQLPRYTNPKDQSGPIIWFGPVLVAGRLVVAGTDGRLLALDPENGSTVGEHHLSSKATVPPIVAAGMMFLLTTDGTLTALG